MKKLISILVAFAMMASLAVTMAFADDPVTSAPITKTLTIPKDTEIPATATAHFDFDLTTVNGQPATAAQKALLEEASLNMKTAPFTKTSPEGTNTDVYTFTVADVLNGIVWPVAGYYEWFVEEDAYVADDGIDETVDHPGKDTTKYKMVVKVIYDSNGTLVPGEVIIKEGTDNPQGGDPTWTQTNDGLAFANTYYASTGNPGEKENPEDPDNPLPDPDNPGNPTNDAAGFAVDKVVTGQFGDQSANGKFQIKIELALPQIGDAAHPTAVIRRAGGAIDPVTISGAGVANVELSHGDKVVFTDIADGTTYTVTEPDARNDASLTEGYTATITNATGTITENANSATVSNKSNQEETTPTGILISNLPYIALALVAIGGLVAYVVVRRRQNDEA